MKLYQRGRVWYLTFYVRGKRVQESTGTSDRRKAEKFCALRLSEVERSEYHQSAKITLAQFGQQYLEYAKANKRSWLRDEQIMAHLNTAMGPTKLGEIGALQIERYKLDRLKQPASPATVNREVALLKHMFNMAVVFREESRQRGEVPTRGQSANPLSFRSGAGEASPVLFSISARPRDVRDQYRAAARRNSKPEMGGGGPGERRHQNVGAEESAHAGSPAERHGSCRGERLVRPAQM
jgi:hypothetical protein